jgi:hypothetical protein
MQLLNYLNTLNAKIYDRLILLTDLIEKHIAELKKSRRYDPVHNCHVYKNVGCAHVDGMYCDMKTCNFEHTIHITPLKKTID